MSYGLEPTCEDLLDEAYALYVRVEQIVSALPVTSPDYERYAATADRLLLRFFRRDWLCDERAD